MINDTEILINFSQQPLQANEPVVVTVTPVDVKQNNSPVPLEELHTKYYHLLVVSEDLSYFSHEHPRQEQNGYTFPYRFPFGGNFILYNDIKPVGAESVVIPKLVHVEGEERDAKRYGEEKLEATQNSLQVHLAYDGSGPIVVELHKDGKKLSPSKVEDYLGAKAHVVMIEVASKAFLHVHAMVHEEKLVLHASFPAKGTYRVWIQLKVERVLYTLDFTLSVKDVARQGHHGH